MIIDKIKKRNMPRPEIKDSKVDIPVGKWVKCNKCGEILYREFLHDNFSICPMCNYHFRLSSRRRIWQTIDDDTFEPFDLNIETVNPLGIEEYNTKLKTLRKINAIDDAIVCGIGKLNGDDVVICVLDGNFMMGSMGTVVGEKIAYSMEKAIELKSPIIIFSVSGGARMQEGIMSLMQMAKTTAAVAKLNEAGILYISVLTDPTYGGVTASFASVADIVLAEPGAMIGFAGPRVIKQTIGQELPEGFQTAEFQLEHGFVDEIVDRSQMKETLSRIIKFHK